MLKDKMLQNRNDRHACVQNNVPEAKTLPSDELESLCRCFERMVVPRNHTFIEQGDTADGSIYIVSHGAVEMFNANQVAREQHYQSGPRCGIRRLRILIEGSLFGAVPLGTVVPFSFVAQSSPCEVLRTSLKQLERLPPAVRSGIQDRVHAATRWRINTTLPLLGGKLPQAFERTNSIPANLRLRQLRSPLQQSLKKGRLSPLGASLPGLAQPLHQGFSHHTWGGPFLASGELGVEGRERSHRSAADPQINKSRSLPSRLFVERS